MSDFYEKLKAENFVVFENNEKAVFTCRNAIEILGEQQTPIFIYGKTGVGKTALLKAIESYLIEKYGIQLKIERLSSRDFLEKFVSSIKKCSDEIDKFKEKYRNLDVLLMDDIQDIAYKEATQEELLYTFNALTETKALMVFTCDRPAKKLSGFNERLKMRFCAGTSVIIPLPNYKKRLQNVLATETGDDKFLKNK